MAKKIIDRQWPLKAFAIATHANMGAGNELTLVVPPGALLLAINVFGLTAFNSETTATLTVSDGTTTFASAVSVATVGTKTVTNVPKYYPTGGTLTVSLAQTGAAATAGAAAVVPEYVIRDRGNEVQE